MMEASKMGLASLTGRRRGAREWEGRVGRQQADERS